MYRAMIIDDEEIVRWGIRDLIDWEASGFELCEDGKDGRDGLKKLLEAAPDLALVDIKMPGIQGIELIRLAREAGFRGHFVILTGYSEFEFAKAAISLGVEEYLLKPVDEEELARCVEKVRRGLDEQARERQRQDAHEETAREELLRGILLRREPRESLEEQMARLGMSFGEEPVRGDFDGRGANEEEPEKASRKWEDFGKDSSLYLYRATMEERLVLVGQGMDHKTWARRLSQRNERLKARYGTGFVIAVGNTVGNWYELSYSYKLAKSLLEQEFLLGQGSVLSIGAIEELQRKAENPPPSTS